MNALLEFVLVVVPQLPAEEWYQQLEQLSAHWIRFPGKQDDLQDVFGDPVGRFCFDLWMVQLFPEQE